jgi:hypothetical protein
MCTAIGWSNVKLQPQRPHTALSARTRLLSHNKLSSNYKVFLVLFTFMSSTHYSCYILSYRLDPLHNNC